MKALPTLPDSCSLDAAGQREQADRYRRAGRGVELVERSPRRLELRLAERVDLADVERLIAVERDCCPFFAIDWRADERRLSFSVARGEHGPALDAIAYALGLEPVIRV
ncbi:MAG TPA: hypothetical protein VHI76_06955 [Solirubrobacterales bacterium]|nr:hypothetical protein [Solirubrobacterales bacterium]